MCLLIDTPVAAGFVVIDNHLMPLPVALTWCKHDGTCTFQHRNQIRYDDGLGKQILTRSEEWGTLPFPDAIGDMEIGAMTRPYTEMTVLKTIGDGVRQGGILNPRLSLVVDIAPGTGRVGCAKKAWRHQLSEFPSTRLDAQLIILTTVGHQSSYIIIYIIYRIRGETVLSQMRIGTDFNGAQRVVDLKTLQMGI